MLAINDLYAASQIELANTKAALDGANQDYRTLAAVLMQIQSGQIQPSQLQITQNGNAFSWTITPLPDAPPSELIPSAPDEALAKGT